jgi:hypothetical protein
MKSLKSVSRICIVSASLLFSGAAFAHPGGHGERELNTATVATLADANLPRLVESKKVGSEWAKAQRESVKLREEAGNWVWVVTYKRAAADGKLYVFFDELGNFLEANHTGQLAPGK